jgi:hypothetical protein
MRCAPRRLRAAADNLSAQTESQFEAAFIAKVVAFDFCDCYLALFYVAFWQR